MQWSPIAIENWKPIDRTSTVCIDCEGRGKKPQQGREGNPRRVPCNSLRWKISHFTSLGATNGVARVKNLDWCFLCSNGKKQGEGFAFCLITLLVTLQEQPSLFPHPWSKLLGISVSFRWRNSRGIGASQNCDRFWKHYNNQCNFASQKLPDITSNLELRLLNDVLRVRKLEETANNYIYYMAESVFFMRLVNLRSVTCYTDQNVKENAHFGALNLFTSERRLKLSYKTSINLEDIDFDFVLQHFKLCLFVNEGDEETNS